jgi:hypothetical protein
MNTTDKEVVMIRKLLGYSLLFIMVASSWAIAQATEGDLLGALLTRQPENGEIDTALIFTNLGGSTATVRVQGFTRSGEPTGNVTVKVPAQGVG